MINLDTGTGFHPDVERRIPEIIAETKGRGNSARKADYVLTFSLPKSRNKTANGGHWARANFTKEKREEIHKAVVDWLGANGFEVEEIIGYKAHARSNPRILKRAVTPVVTRCKVAIAIFKPNAVRIDVHNADCKPYFDGLNDANFWPDDNEDVIPAVSFRLFGIDRDNPRVEFHIFKLS